MSTCDLSIKLKRSTRSYLPGEMVEGVVRFVAKRGLSCSGLILSSVWKTHGRGNVESEELNKTKLFAGTWAAGSVHEYEFSVPAGCWPPSYDGKIVSFGHYINVKAEIPWGRDPHKSCPYRVKPRMLQQQEEVVEYESKPKSTTSLPVYLWKQYWWLPVIVLLGAAFVSKLVAFIKYGVIEPGDDFFVVMVLITVSLVSLWLFFFQFLPARVLGYPELFIEKDYLRIGGEVRGQFLTTTRRDLPVSSMIAVIKATECCSSGSGSSAKYYEHVICKGRQVFQPATVLREGKALSFPFRFKLPETGPCSVHLVSNHLRWELNVRIDIPNCPDWQETVSLWIEPPLLAERKPDWKS